MAVRHPSPSEWRIGTSSRQSLALRLHLTNVPGWRATIDGRPLTLVPYVGMMLQARIPPGTHTIIVRYWPQALTDGIILALASAVFLLGLLVCSTILKRRRPVTTERSPDSPVA